MPQPALQCPREPSCIYTERNLTLDGYRYQLMVRSGGADWDTQFWVSEAQGRLLLAVPPMRGNAFLAVRGTDPNDPTPSVRVVGDYYAPTDPGSAPSGFTSTVCNYSPSTQAMLPE